MTGSPPAPPIGDNITHVICDRLREQMNHSGGIYSNLYSSSCSEMYTFKPYLQGFIPWAKLTTAHMIYKSIGNIWITTSTHFTTDRNMKKQNHKKIHLEIHLRSKYFMCDTDNAFIQPGVNRFNQWAFCWTPQPKNMKCFLVSRTDPTLPTQPTQPTQPNPPWHNFN